MSDELTRAQQRIAELEHVVGGLKSNAKAVARAHADQVQALEEKNTSLRGCLATAVTEQEKLDATNTRLRGVVVAAENWLAGVVSACGRALAGDLDRKTLAATLRLVVQRAQDQRAALRDVLDATSDKSALRNPEPEAK